MAMAFQNSTNFKIILLMIIYLAGGMGLMNVIGREREVSNMFSVWNRLFSYHYKQLIEKSEILSIAKEKNNENILSNLDARKGTRRKSDKKKVETSTNVILPHQKSKRTRRKNVCQGG